MGTLAARLWTVLCLVSVESSWALRSLGSPNRIVVSPSVAEADFLRLGSELESTIQAGAEWLHFPIDDRRRLGGVPLGPSVVAACRQSFPRTILDVMLGCNGPENRVNEFVRAGADIISVHPEATKRLGAVLQAIKAAGVAPGVVLSPTTSVATVESVLPHCQVAVILMPSPDRRSPNGIEQAVEKIRRLRFLRPDLHISVDGGIREQDDNLLISAGANVLVAGAGLFMSANQRAVIDYLKRKQAPQVGYRYRGQLDPLKRNKDAMFFASRPGEGPNQELVGRRLWSNLQPKAAVSSKTSTFYNLKTGDVHRNEYVVWSNPNFQKETHGMFFPTPPDLPKYPNHELTKAWADNPMGAVSSTSTSVYKLTNDQAPKDYVLWSDSHFHGGHDDMFFEPPELVQDPNHELSKVWSEYPVDGSATTTVYKRSSSALPNGYVLWSNQHDLVSSSADYSFAVNPNNEYKRTPDGNYMWSNPTGFVSSTNNLQTPNGMWAGSVDDLAPNGAVVSGQADGHIPPQAQDYRPADGERSNGYTQHAIMSPERASVEANNGYKQQQQQQQRVMRPDGTQPTNGSTNGYRQSNGYSEPNRQNNGYSPNQRPRSGFGPGGRVSTDSYTTGNTQNSDNTWSGSTATNGPKRYTPPPQGGEGRNWSNPKRNAADRASTERNGYTQGGESTGADPKRDAADHISAERYNGYTPPQESTGSDPKRDAASHISTETYNNGYMPPQGGESQQWSDPRSDASGPVSTETYNNAYMQTPSGDNTWSGDTLPTGGVTDESYNHGYVQTDNGESLSPGSDPGSDVASQSYSNGYSKSDESTWSGPDQGEDVSSAGVVSSTEDCDNGYFENARIWSATNGVQTENAETTWPDSGQPDDNSSVDKVSIDTSGVPTQDPYDSSMWSGSNGSAYPETTSPGAVSNGQAQTQNDDAMWSDLNHNDPFFAADKAATETNQEELAQEPSDKNMWFASEENAATAGDSVSADTASTEANSAFLQDDIWAGTNENGVVSEADASSTENSNVESAWPGPEPEESFFADMHEQVQTLRDEDLWPTSNEHEVPEGGSSVETNSLGETDQGIESSWSDSSEDVAPTDNFPSEMPDMEVRIPSEEEMWLGSNQIEPPQGTDNLYLPNYLEGTWQVTQTLTGTSKPGGWPISGHSGEKSITQRYLEETLLEDAAGVTMHMQLRYVRTKWGVTEDRLFNTHQRLNAMAGVPIVGDVQYGNVRTSNRAAILANGGSEFDPLQTTVTRYHIPATRKTFVLSHDSIPGKAKGFWVGCELQRSIFSVDDLSAPPPITMDSEFRWEFQPIDLHHVRAKLRVAEFKAETGAAQSGNQVSFRDYVLDMIRIGL